MNFLAESIEPDELPQTTIVFDSRGAPPGLPRTLNHRGMAVLFAPRDEEADDLIEELIRAASAPRRLVVVSSDRIQRAARRRKAKAVDSDLWYAELVRSRRERRETSSEKPARPAVPRPDAAGANDKLKDRKPIEFGSAEDYQLQQARNHLKGQPVQVPSDGVVVFNGVEGGYGKVLVIDHGYGVKTRYGHLSEVHVRLGDRVKRGDKVGAVGNTGKSTGPHLHYEVRVNGIPENPRKFILE